jgi:single-stranded DNA-specific DHH superfamily exonuclease
MDKNQLGQLESRIQALKSSLSNIGDTSDVQELFAVIHNPGWTTLAEIAFVGTILDSMEQQTRNLILLRKGLLSGAKAIRAAQTAGAD